MTLLVPEWVLAWALRQFLQAVEYAEMLEKARLKADRLEKERSELSVGRSRDDQDSSKKDSEDTPLLETEKGDRCVRPELETSLFLTKASVELARL